MRKLQLVQAFKMEQDNPHLQLYRKAFPQARPTIFQMELIEGTVTDAEAWKQTITFWAGNNYRAESVFKMIEYYKEALGKRKFASVETEQDYNCPLCFDTGEVSVAVEDSPNKLEWVACKCKVEVV